VRVFADVKKKHSSHAITADLDVVETARAAEFFLADGVIVTGVASGRPARPDEVAAVAAAVGVLTLVGSGIDAENMSDYPGADAFIVGTWLKLDGIWSNPLDPERLDRLVRAFGRLPPRS
jgi:predicted TIM-barrel enzyme